MAPKYLFIRILEQCNASCWFCDFANSKDKYRLSLEDYIEILDEAKKSGIEYIRFTGGETLLHKDLPIFIELANNMEIKTSIITNGLLLNQRIENLVKKGLNQVIVSIDNIGEKHNEIRSTKNLFENAIAGLKKAKKMNIATRVNTVCGPHNFRDLPKLQKIFTEMEIDYWELSALKLEDKIEYDDVSLKEINNILNEIYLREKGKKKLIPFGKKWCGDTDLEKKRYFQDSIPPTPTSICNIANYVRYYDPKNKRLYICSLTPHRDLDERYFIQFTKNQKFKLNTKKENDISKYFYNNGPLICKGCSSTASGCSDYITNNKKSFEWIY